MTGTSGMRVALRGLVLLAACTVLGLGGAYLVPSLRPRLQIVVLKVTGRLPQVRYAELLPLLRPRAGFDIDALAHTGNALASLQLPGSLARDTAAGAALFAQRCAQCHGPRGEGGIGPPLADGFNRHGVTDWSAFRVIQDGVAGTAMRPLGLDFDQTWRVIAHLRALQRSASIRTTGQIDSVPRTPPVSAEQIATADSTDRDWLLYSGGWAARRNREVPELDARSIGRLRLVWVHQFPADPPISQSTPIAARGKVFITTLREVIALDQVSGAVVWRFHRELQQEARACCARSNRGVAILGNRVLVGTLDAHLIALDSETGRVDWDVVVADPTAGNTINAAPMVMDGKVLIGIGGGEFGIRGFLDAYDPNTGKRLWRFYTIPDKGEPGRETWPADGLPPGGGPTWVPGAYDPVRRLVYWGVGNPSPEFAPELRPGDNLYTNSVVALDIDSGALKWYYQFTPQDSHDWDSAQSPILVDANWQGRKRPLILWANRNGFFYVLDRETGEFLRATPFVEQTWNAGFDSAGRPIIRPNMQPSLTGTIVYPGVGGATNWWPSSFSERLGLLFVSVRKSGDIFFRDPHLTSENGQYLGGRTQPVPGEERTSSVQAIELVTGKLRWSTTAPENKSPTMGGLLSISDRLVLGAQSNTFFALDAATGRRLWQVGLGAPVQGAPIVFRTAGKVRIALTGGSVLFVFEVGDS